MSKYFYAIFCILFVLFAFAMHRDNARAVSLTFNDYTTGSVINSTELNTNILGRMETAVSQLNTQFVNYTGNDRLSVSLFNTYTGNDKVPYTFFNNYSSGVNTRLTNVNSTNITNRFVNFSTSANNRINNKADSTLYSNLSTSFDSRIDTKKSAAQFNTYSTGVNGQFAFKAAHSLTNLYVDSTGSPNAYTLDYTPNYTAYSDGMVIIFKAAFENTGSATVNIDGLGAKTLYKDFNGTLASGDILNDQIVTAVYDSTLGGFQIISYSVASGSGSGETNTAANVGDNGIGLYKQKVGSELQFYNMTSTDGSVIFLLNAGANYYDVKSTASGGGIYQQAVYGEYTAHKTVTEDISAGAAPPVMSTMNKILTMSITPSNAANHIEVEANVPMWGSSVGNHFVAVYDNNSTCKSIIAEAGTNTYWVTPTLKSDFVAGGTDPIRIHLCVANGPSGTTYINGDNTTRKLYDAMEVRMVLREYTP